MPLHPVPIAKQVSRNGHLRVLWRADQETISNGAAKRRERLTRSGFSWLILCGFKLPRGSQPRHSVKGTLDNP